MKALLYLDQARQWRPNTEGVIGPIELTADHLVLGPGGTLPGRFLLEVGDDTPGRFIVKWGGKPATPVLTLTPSTDRFVLSWTSVDCDGTLTYNIYRHANSAIPVLYQEGITGTTYTDTAVTRTVRYFYWVSAVCDDTEGDRSDPKDGALPALPAPVMNPSVLSAEWSDAVWTIPPTIFCVWDFSNFHAGELHRIYYSFNGWATEVAFETGSLLFTYVNDISAYITIATHDPPLPTAFYDIWLAVQRYSVDNYPGATTPLRPTAFINGRAPPEFVGYDPGIGQVSLSWSPPPIALVHTYLPTEYRIYYSQSSGGAESEIVVDGSETSYVVSGLTNGVQYKFVIVAEYDYQDCRYKRSYESGSVYATPYTAPDVPAIAGGAGDGWMNVNWNAASGVTRPIIYDVQWNTNDAGWVDFRTSWLPGTHTDPAPGVFLFFTQTATNGVKYEWRMRSKDGQNQTSDWSNVLELHPAAVAPTIYQHPISKSGKVGDAITLTAQAVGNAGHELSYKWFFSHYEDAYANWVELPGELDNNLLLTSTQIVDAGFYFLRITDTINLSYVDTRYVCIFLVDQTRNIDYTQLTRDLGLVLTQSGETTVLVNWLTPYAWPNQTGTEVTCLYAGEYWINSSTAQWTNENSDLFFQLVGLALGTTVNARIHWKVSKFAPEGTPLEVIGVSHQQRITTSNLHFVLEPVNFYGMANSSGHMMSVVVEGAQGTVYCQWQWSSSADGPWYDYGAESTSTKFFFTNLGISGQAPGFYRARVHDALNTIYSTWAVALVFGPLVFTATSVGHTTTWDAVFSWEALSYWEPCLAAWATGPEWIEFTIQTSESGSPGTWTTHDNVTSPFTVEDLAATVEKLYAILSFKIVWNGGNDETDDVTTKSAEAICPFVAPTITTHPASVLIEQGAGSNAVFTVAATGSGGTLKYWWLFWLDSDSSWHYFTPDPTSWAGELTATLTMLNPTVAGGWTTVRCAVGQNGHWAYSNPAWVGIIKPTIPTEADENLPALLVVDAGGLAGLPVPVPTYQWYFCPAEYGIGGTYGPVSGGNYAITTLLRVWKNDYVVKGRVATDAHEGFYKCYITANNKTLWTTPQKMVVRNIWAYARIVRYTLSDWITPAAMPYPVAPYGIYSLPDVRGMGFLEQNVPGQVIISGSHGFFFEIQITHIGPARLLYFVHDTYYLLPLTAADFLSVSIYMNGSTLDVCWLPTTAGSNHVERYVTLPTSATASVVTILFAHYFHDDAQQTYLKSVVFLDAQV